MGNIIQSIPEAKLLLASLRSVGYTEETAIADIVDNCISAKAKHIDIIFETEKMRILILDDGIGMTAQALIENMRIGSSDPSKQRDDTDLGRFGMGMKTAAFSLGKRLTVVTRIEETTSNAAWDLDKIPDIGWNLIIEESDSIKIYSVNGKSEDALLYKNNEGKPFNVIVIGGDKLSRGLTLEGLTISYFTRSSNTYPVLLFLLSGYVHTNIICCR